MLDLVCTKNVSGSCNVIILQERCPFTFGPPSKPLGKNQVLNSSDKKKNGIVAATSHVKAYILEKHNDRLIYQFMYE